ncbi:MAG: hypothetical protein KGI67_15225, partial [Pseudomonadota bacterium]|nr:hypothetical protein [Pseudomonadota bacterium]
AALLALLLAIAWDLLAVRSAAARPFPPSQPPAPSSTLPSVLKALHLQRAFVAFAATAQEADAATLHARFGEFLQAHCPDDLADATQAPGEAGF